MDQLVEAIGGGQIVAAIPYARQDQMNLPAVREDGDTGAVPWTWALYVLGERLAAAGSATVCQNR